MVYWQVKISHQVVLSKKKVEENNWRKITDFWTTTAKKKKTLLTKDSRDRFVCYTFHTVSFKLDIDHISESSWKSAIINFHNDINYLIKKWNTNPGKVQFIALPSLSKLLFRNNLLIWFLWTFLLRFCLWFVNIIWLLIWREPNIKIDQPMNFYFHQFEFCFNFACWTQRNYSFFPEYFVIFGKWHLKTVYHGSSHQRDANTFELWFE